MTVLFATLIVVILGAAGLAIDFGRTEGIKSKVQIAMDAAVLAGAVAQPGAEIGTAERYFAAELSSFSLTGFTAHFAVNGSGEVSGTAHGEMNTSLLAVIGFKEVAIGATSSATRNVAGRVCALVLDPTASQALLVNGGADISAPQCEFHVKSTANPAAIFNAGTNLTTAKICIAGANIIDNGGVHPGLQTSCATASDPYAGTFPDPASATCDFSNGNYSGGTVNLTPGVYCGWHNFNAAPDVNFAPGVYVIQGGGWNVNGGTWAGNGVVFYYADQSKIQFNSGVSATLTAPSSGPYEGVMMFEKEGLARSPFVLDDSQNFDLEGLLYLPSRDTIFNAASNLSNKKMTLVVNTLILDQTSWQLDPDANSIPGGGSAGQSRLTR
ncbi:MAG: Tad domain-containing protein [Hyphomicrobium sp.]